MYTITETNITIMVSDMDQAVNFYESLGATVKNRWENNYAQLEIGNVILGIHPAHGKPAGSGNVSLGFIVDDLDEVKKLLAEKNIAFQEQDDKAGTFATLKDADGTDIYFMQPKMTW